jgi:hypothetical protein
MSRRLSNHRFWMLAAVIGFGAACEREERRLNEPPPQPPVTFVSQSPL